MRSRLSREFTVKAIIFGVIFAVLGLNFLDWLPLIWDALIIFSVLIMFAVVFWSETIVLMVNREKHSTSKLIPRYTLKWLSVLAMIGLLLVFLPGLIGARSKSADIQVLENMENFRRIVIAFAKDHEGDFPQSVDHEIKCYFPGGNRNTKLIGAAPINPYTWKAEWPVSGTITNVYEAKLTFESPLRRGCLEYTPIHDVNGRTIDFAIRGGGRGNRPISSSDSAGTKPLVLSAEPRISDTSTSSKP